MRNQRMLRPFLSLTLFFALALAIPRAARAGDLQIAAGGGASGSAWSGDAAGYGTFRIAWRAWDVVAPYFMVRLGYGSVDRRLLTMLSAGVQAWGRLGSFRPYVRVGAMHGHEEPWPAVQQQPWLAVFGVGDGIRHRTGIEGGVGFDVPLRRWKKVALYISAEAQLAWLTASSGPSGYWGGGVALGVNYSL